MCSVLEKETEKIKSKLPSRKFEKKSSFMIKKVIGVKRLCTVTVTYSGLKTLISDTENSNTLKSKIIFWKLEIAHVAYVRDIYHNQN